MGSYISFDAAANRRNCKLSIFFCHCEPKRFSAAWRPGHILRCGNLVSNQYHQAFYCYEFADYTSRIYFLSPLSSFQQRPCDSLS